MAKQDDSSAEPPNAPPSVVDGIESTWRPALTSAMPPSQDGPAAPDSAAPIARDATPLAAAAPVLGQRPALVFRASHTGSGLAAALFGSQTSDMPDRAAPAVPLPSEYPVSNWDRYEFLELLGRGGMGCVYKARDRRIHRIVALKFIDGAGKRLKERFMQEARTQARIDHPSVCKVLEVGEVEGKAYIAMEFIDGQSLHRAKSLLSIEEKIRLVQQTAEALHAAHELGIIHRVLLSEEFPSRYQPLRRFGKKSGKIGNFAHLYLGHGKVPQVIRCRGPRQPRSFLSASNPSE